MYDKPQCQLVWDLQQKQEVKERYIKVGVYFPAEQLTKYYSTKCKVKLTKDEFNNKNLKKTREAMREAEKDLFIAQTICNEIGIKITHKEFKLRFDNAKFEKSISYSNDFTIKDFLQQYFFVKESAQNTQTNYTSAFRWVQLYSPSATMKDLTPDFIKGLESFMKKTYKKETGNDLSINTLAMYKRAIKAVCSEAVKEKILDINPVIGHIQTAPRTKRAIPTNDFMAFLQYQPEKGKNTEFAHDFAILNFALCGANFADILSLQNKNICGDKLSFTRKKTERVDTQIAIPINSIARRIINKYGNIDPKLPNAYVLPYYARTHSIKGQNYIRNDIIKKINKGIAEICNEIGIEKFTTYNIRHTFAVLSRDEGEMSVEQLQMLLGHKNPQTTTNYLQSITNTLTAKTESFIDNIMQKAKIN